MSTALRTHPHPDALRDFVLGHLPAEEARQLEEHIAACAECCANLSRCEADTDPLVCWLKQASPTTPPVSGPSEYLTRDANTSSRDSAEVLTPPNILGRYEILAELGKGGMGVVYKARDTQLKRLVAIKMMRNSTFDSEENRARFHAEGLAVARLRHPHIVQLLEVGEAEGSPYLVLEYLDGGSLSDNRKLAGPMDVMEAAALVQKLAEAIAHAHAEGVIHRDLKPANVLLTADGLAKITDFGLVKFDRQIVPGTLPLKETTTGFIVGTPHYMSPEQASGRPGVIGPATDIYALGAILYELLTDDPPFADLSNPIEVLQTIQEREPPSPRRFRPDLPRDLEVICMKCLRLEQHRRYLTASELAAELGRFLGGEPILARPLSWRQRAGRWCRRNPMVAGLLSGLAAVIVASLIGLTWLYLDADAQRQRAEQQERDARLFAQEAERKGKEALQQKAETDRQRQEALDYFSIARQAIEAFQTRVINDTKLREHDFRPLRSTLLESSLRFHEALVRHRTDNPQLQMFQGYAYVQLGALREELGQNNEALAAYGKGIDTYLNLAGQSSQREMAHKHVVDVWVRRSVLLKRLGQFPKALADLKAAIAVQEELSATYPQDQGMLFNLMVCRGNYAEILSGMGRRTEALAELQANLPQIEALVAASATSAHRYLLAYCCQSLGDILAAEQPAKALPYLQRARALSVRLAAETPTDPDRPYVLARSCASLGLALHRLEKYTAAQEAQQEGLATMDKLLRHHPHVPEYRVVRAGMACNLGLFFQLNEAPEKALPLYDQAIQELQRLLAQDPRMVKAHHYLANTYTNRAGVYDKLGRDKEALADWEAVLKLRPSPEIQFFRARSLLRLGRVEEGLTTLRQVLKADSDSFQRFTAARLWCLAAEKTQAQPQQAERYLQEARRLLQGLLADGYLQQPVTLNVLQTNPDFAILRQQKNGARSLPTPNSKE